MIMGNIGIRSYISLAWYWDEGYLAVGHPPIIYVHRMKITTGLVKSDSGPINPQLMHSPSRTFLKAIIGLKHAMVATRKLL